MTKISPFFSPTNRVYLPNSRRFLVVSHGTITHAKATCCIRTQSSCRFFKKTGQKTPVNCMPVVVVAAVEGLLSRLLCILQQCGAVVLCHRCLRSNPCPIRPKPINLPPYTWSMCADGLPRGKSALSFCLNIDSAHKLERFHRCCSFLFCLRRPSAV